MTYANETNPVLDYYKKNTNFYEVDGNMKIGEIYNEIEAILKIIRDWHYVCFIYMFLFKINPL